jgi:hypothetical protein
MAHIIGHGRRARETYPERAPAASPSLIQVGYDQPIEDMIVPATAFAFFPRSVGAPLRKVLPGVVPGNVLEVEWHLNLRASVDYYVFLFKIAAVAAVTFDGTNPTIPSATTFLIINSWGNMTLHPSAPDQDAQSASGMAAVEIPGGATIATVQLLYVSPGAFEVNNGTIYVDEAGLAAVLKVSEISSDVVVSGLGTLTPTA